MVKVFVISGAPGTGKTSVIDELRKQGFSTINEASRELGDDERFKGETKMPEFQKAIFELQKQALEKLGEDVVFTDRGFGDTLAYYKFYNIEIPESVLGYIKKTRYSGIFVLDFLKEYKTDLLRQETPEQQKIVHKLIIKTYGDLGYQIVRVPLMSVKERVKFIKNNSFHH